MCISFLSQCLVMLRLLFSPELFSVFITVFVICCNTVCEIIQRKSECSY